MVISSLESSFLFITIFNFHLMVGTIQIQLSKILDLT